MATAGSMSSIPAQEHFTSHVVQPKREREREKGGQDQRQRDGEDGHVQVEAETGVVLPQAEHHQRPLDPGKGKEGLSLEPLQCVYPADTLILDFWAPEQGENHFLLFEATKSVETC